MESPPRGGGAQMLSAATRRLGVAGGQRQTLGTARGTLQKGSNDTEELAQPLELELKQRVQRSSCSNMPANVSANIQFCNLK